MNLVLIGGLSNEKFISKTIPLVKSNKVKKIYLFRPNGNVYSNNSKIINLPFISKTKNYNSNLFQRLIFDLYHLVGLSIIFCFRKVDFIIGIYLYPYGSYASLFGKFFNIPTILILPGTDFKQLKEKKKNIKLFYDASYIGLRGSKTKGEMIKMGFKEKKLFVLPNVIEVQNAISIHGKKTVDIIFCGFLRKLKRINLVIDTVEKLKIKIPNVSCLIIGNGPERRSLEFLVSKRGLDKNIKFVDYQYPIHGMLVTAKLFLLTSESEGLPMSIVEAIECGIPTVASNINDIPDVIVNGYNGILVDHTNQEEYYDACYKLLINNNLRAKMSKNARESFLNYYKSNSSLEAVSGIWDRIFDLS